MKRLFSLSAICLCVCAIALIASVSADDPVNEEPGDDPTTYDNPSCKNPSYHCQQRARPCNLGNPEICGDPVPPATDCTCVPTHEPEPTPNTPACFCRAT